VAVVATPAAAYHPAPAPLEQDLHVDEAIVAPAQVRLHGGILPGVREARFELRVAGLGIGLALAALGASGLAAFAVFSERRARDVA
jgi:hypothetical protein